MGGRDTGGRRAGPLRTRYRGDPHPAVADALRRLDYRGSVAMEAFASADPDLALQRFIAAFSH